MEHIRSDIAVKFKKIGVMQFAMLMHRVKDAAVRTPWHNHYPIARATQDDAPGQQLNLESVLHRASSISNPS
jgi:hypothetical protein